MFEKIARTWLFIILIFLPFQRKIVKLLLPFNKELGYVVSYIDEITVAIFILLAVFKFYRKREFPDSLFIILLSPIVIFSIVGFSSGLTKGNPLFVTSLGIFDYIKNFIVIFVYASFVRDFKDFKKLFNVLLTVAVVLGTIAIAQEVWALAGRYIFLSIKDFSNPSWRIGLYRTPSLMHNPNVFGLYCLVILTLYLSIIRRPKYLFTIPLISGILTSVSRIAYAGFMFLGASQIYKGRRWFVAMLIPLIILMLIIFSMRIWIS